MALSQIELESRIGNFLARKFQKFPELMDSPFSPETREFIGPHLSWTRTLKRV